MNEIDKSFEQVTSIIENARNNAYRKVNEELILMYQSVGRFLSEQSKEASYGDGYIDSLSSYIQEHFPGIKGFNRRGLYRMKQFFELYDGNEKVSPLVTQLSWTNHLLIMSSCKSDEEREFYMRLAIKERYSKRELERQMDSGYYERYMLSKEKPLPEKIKSELNPFLDSYVIEFLDLPPKFKEKYLKIEPKGTIYLENDAWKERFLVYMKMANAAVPVKILKDNNDYFIWGFHFFNQDERMKEFTMDFGSLLGGRDTSIKAITAYAENLGQMLKKKQEQDESQSE